MKRITIKKSRNKRARAVDGTSGSAAAFVRTVSSQLAYTQTYTAPLNYNTFSAYNTLNTIPITFTPTTSMRNQFDRFIVEEVLLSFYFLPAQGNVANSSSSVTVVPFGMAYDPTGDNAGLLTNQTGILNFHNSQRVALSAGKPIFEYKIMRPTNSYYGVSSTTRIASRDPVATDYQWDAGSVVTCTLYPSALSALVGTGYSIGYNIQYKVRYTGPRSN